MMETMSIGLEAAREAFYAAARSEAVPFVLDDAVDVVSGALAGICGAVISLEGVQPVTVLVERGDGGGDVVVLARDLRLRQSSPGLSEAAFAQAPLEQ